MTTSTTSQGSVASAPWWALFLAGLRCSSWRTVGLILAINTAVAILLFTEETRPFWHPFITAQCVGLSIAYAVNAAQPWESAHPLRRLLVAVVGGTVVGMLLLLVIKGYIIGDPEYRMGSLHGHASPGMVVGTGISALVLGLCVSLFFLLKIRDALSRAAMLKAEAERNLLSKQAVEAELKLMQAQVEPHFLFNTLAHIVRLHQVDAHKGQQMLRSLTEYMRSALPQMRGADCTLARELALTRSYAEVQQIRMGERLRVEIDVPAALLEARVPAMTVLTLAENAVKHGLGPKREGGTLRIEASLRDEMLEVAVCDDGVGLQLGAGTGHGLSNTRSRLEAAYGPRAALEIENWPAGGVRAALLLPFAPLAAQGLAQ